VSSFIFQLDKPSFNNTGSDKALLTVMALDANSPIIAADLSVGDQRN
jgi:hypothetical protein